MIKRVEVLVERFFFAFQDENFFASLVLFSFKYGSLREEGNN